jgi:hypothetical protein
MPVRTEKRKRLKSKELGYLKFCEVTPIPHLFVKCAQRDENSVVRADLERTICGKCAEGAEKKQVIEMQVRTVEKARLVPRISHSG